MKSRILSLRHILLVLTVALLAVAAYVGCSSSGNEYDRFRDRDVAEIAREGYQHLSQGHADSAMVRFAALQNLDPDNFSPLQQSQAAGWLCRAADVLTTAGGDYAQAYDHLLTARSMAENAKDDSLANEVDFRMAGINFIFLDYEKSHAMVKECFDRATRQGQHGMMLKSLSNLITTAFVTPGGYDELAPQLSRLDSARIQPSPACASWNTSATPWPRTNGATRVPRSRALTRPWNTWTAHGTTGSRATWWARSRPCCCAPAATTGEPWNVSAHSTPRCPKAVSATTKACENATRAWGWATPRSTTWG